MIRKPFQIAGAKFLAPRKRAFLLDDPGLGKTSQAIDAADMAGIGGIGVVCPASVVTQWRREHERLAVNLRPFDSRSYEAARDKGMRNHPLALLDEVHYLKNGGARRTLGILGTKIYGGDGGIIKADVVWGLSGTFMPSSPLDLFAPLLAITPGALALDHGNRTMDYYQFSRTFCDVYEGPYGPIVKGVKRMDELKERMAPFVLRRTKKDVIEDYKEPLCSDLWLDAGNAAAKLKAIEGDMQGRKVASAFEAGGFDALKEEAEYAATYRRYTGLLKVPAITEWLLDQFDGGLQKIVVMCYHREVIAQLLVAMDNAKVKAVTYMGGMTGRNQEKAKTDFINKPNVRAFIAQIDSVGTGTDGLQHATGDMLFAECSWLHSQNKQAIDRLDRFGQTNPVNVRFGGFEGSIDGAIMAAAGRRAAQGVALFN